MYDAPFDLGTVLGWVLAGVVGLLLVARALRTEWRATLVGPRATASRILDAGIDVLLAVAVAGLIATLLALVVAAFAGPA